MWGFQGGIGLGNPLNAKDPGNFLQTGGVARYAGTTNDGGGQDGILLLAGHGSMSGVAGGGGAFIAFDYRDVNQLSDYTRAEGMLLGPISVERYLDKNGKSVGYGFGFLSKGLGIGPYSLDVNTTTFPIENYPSTLWSTDCK